MKNINRCQSCYKILTPINRGEESNGDKSEIYCNDCYNNSEFRYKYMTLDEMIYTVDNDLSKFFMPKFLRKKYTNNIKNLERWRNYNEEEII